VTVWSLASKAIGSMPYKFNKSRRHRTCRAKYRVTNWPDSASALIRRGSLKVWLTGGGDRGLAGAGHWKAGGQPIYWAIALCRVRSHRCATEEAGKIDQINAFRPQVKRQYRPASLPRKALPSSRLAVRTARPAAACTATGPVSAA